MKEASRRVGFQVQRLCNVALFKAETDGGCLFCVCEFGGWEEEEGG